ASSTPATGPSPQRCSADSRVRNPPARRITTRGGQLCSRTAFIRVFVANSIRPDSILLRVRSIDGADPAGRPDLQHRFAADVVDGHGALEFVPDMRPGIRGFV